MPPRRGGNAEPLARFERCLDRLAEAVEWDGDVLARLPATLCVDDERKAVAPAPERRDLLCRLRCVQRECVLSEHLEQVVANALGLVA